MSFCRPDQELDDQSRDFVSAAGWSGCGVQILAGDASSRKYFRLTGRQGSAVLMDARRNLESVAPFVSLDEHLCRFGLRAPRILFRDMANGFLLLEDFGNDTFARLLENGANSEELYRLATELLITLHKSASAVPAGLRSYTSEKMLGDIELFLDWRTPGIAEAAREEFRQAWLEVLPQAHKVPSSLLLRDYHVANLMLIDAEREIQRVGLLDFQDAYQGPVTYDLVSLLEDARRDVPEQIVMKLREYYLEQFPELDREAFASSSAIVAAQRHTRVLAIFERLSLRDGKHEYKKLHAARVEHRLRAALQHPILEGVNRWMERYAS